MRPPGHEGVARSDSGNWGVSDPLPGLSGTVPGGLPAAHPDLRPDTGAGGDRDRPAESESVGCQWTRLCAGGARRAGPELSSQPRRHSRHDRGTGEWGTVCGALCHPDRYDAAEGLYDTLYSKADQETEAASMSAMVVFPLYYLALVLTMTAATILTVQQLSETDRYRGQLALLRKLGMDRREMRRALGCPVCHLLRHACPSAGAHCSSLSPEPGRRGGAGNHDGDLSPPQPSPPWRWGCAA